MSEVGLVDGGQAGLSNTGSCEEDESYDLQDDFQGDEAELYCVDDELHSEHVMLPNEQIQVSWNAKMAESEWLNAFRDLGEGGLQLTGDARDGDDERENDARYSLREISFDSKEDAKLVDEKQDDEKNDLAWQHARRKWQRLAFEHEGERLDDQPEYVVPLIQV